jgi:hypothetical protein
MPTERIALTKAMTRSGTVLGKREQLRLKDLERLYKN